MTSWRAGCGESRTSGSGGGPGKRTGRETGAAPRVDLTWLATPWTGADAGSSPDRAAWTIVANVLLNLDETLTKM